MTLHFISSLVVPSALEIEIKERFLFKFLQSESSADHQIFRKKINAKSFTAFFAGHGGVNQLGMLMLIII